ncbi:hypothetical protein BELL_0904g00040 [Botrytis elliptica]|uniref:Uncharacterized protein n=1 Tax=Botrytis elliptica TaxID=278938 RepID=A0A4Z1J0S3_9HELO|nr:hypothetical protein BELL_0904g00040 [Botrytis elliptica]
MANLGESLQYLLFNFPLKLIFPVHALLSIDNACTSSNVLDWTSIRNGTASNLELALDGEGHATDTETSEIKSIDWCYPGASETAALGAQRCGGDVGGGCIGRRIGFDCSWFDWV